MGKFNSSTKRVFSDENDVAKKSKTPAIRSSLCTNDVEWYKHYETLSSDTSRLFMSRPNGMDYPELKTQFVDNSLTVFPVSNTSLYKKQGGILTLGIVPMYGGNFDYWKPNNALNNAASKLYYYIVHGNSRNISYDKSDLMRCIIAFDNIQMLIEEAKRAYRLAKNIKVSNRWDKNLITAAGWDYNDISSNLVEFRTQINLAIQKFNQISIPAVFDIFKSHREMVSWVYRDRLDDKCQYMLNKPIGYWLYDDEHATLDFVTEGLLNNGYFGPWGAGNTVNSFVNLVNYMIHTVYDSTDMGVMQGDIKRAFADSQLLTIDMLVDDDFVPIVYDEEFNSKVHNLELGNYPDRHQINLVVEPNTNYLSSGVISDTDNVSGNLYCMMVGNSTALKSTSIYSDNVHIMDLPDHLKDDTNEIIIAQTRKCHGAYDKQLYFIDDAAGSEINVDFYDCLDSVTVNLVYYYDPQDMANNYIAVNGVKDLLRGTFESLKFFIKLSELAVIPRLPFMCKNGTNYETVAPAWEVNNVTVYSDDVLKNMLNVMTESLFYNSLLYNNA